MDLKHWLVQLFIAIDQLANVLVTPLSGGAWADETLSSRAYRADRDGKLFGRFWRPLIDVLFSWQKQPPEVEGHCHGAFLREIARYNSPPEQRAPSPADE